MTRKKKVKKTKAKKKVRKSPKRKIAKKKVRKRFKNLAKRKIIAKKRAVLRKKKAVQEKAEGISVEKKSPVDELVDVGKRRGFVTEDEILHVIPEVERDLAGLEKLYEKLETAGVKIVSSDEVIKTEIEKEAERQEKKIDDMDVPLGLDDVSSDSVQMYLREIGRVPLLTADEEVYLAKRIEKGDLASKQKLTEA